MVCSAFVAFSPATDLAYSKGRQNGLFFTLNCLSLNLSDSTAICGRIWCRPVLVVGVKVAVLAQALAIVSLSRVLTGPRFLCAAAPVVAVDAHALGVVFAVRVGALSDDSFRRRRLLV